MKSIFLTFFFAANLFAANYYIKNTGNDNSNGLSDKTAWRTIAKVNSFKFKPGDNIYFKRGDLWREQLNFPSSGSQTQPVTIDAYGNGNAPIINAANIITSWTENTTNVWAANYSPNSTSWNSIVVAVNGVLYNLVNSISNLNSENEFYIDGTSNPLSIYIYSKTDPNASLVEASSRQYGIYLDSKQYINIKNIDCRYASYAGIRLNGPQPNGYCFIDSCNLYANRQDGIIMYNGHNNNTISNCVADYNGNGFYSNIADENTFSNNVASHNIHYTNGVYTDGHGFGIYKGNDCIVENCEASDNYSNLNFDGANGANSITIRYNYFHNSQSHTGGIIIGNVASGGLVNIYYNLLTNNGGSDNGAGFGVDTQIGGKLNFLNNTIYQNAFGEGCIYFVNADNCTIKNNILANLRSFGYCLIIGKGNINSDYNQFYLPNNNDIIQTGSTGYSSLSAWTSNSNQDSHSKSGDPLFTNPGINDYILQKNSPSIIAGINVSLDKDFNGMSIPEYQPDIGAFQHIFIQANIKVFLQGPYRDGVMTDLLNTENLIPNSQPYNISPWNYSGKESVNAVPPLIVDWVIVELRTNIYGNTTIARRACFLRNDGYIVDLDGKSLLRFDFIPEGNYYVVVRHRNHLAVMSSSAIWLSDKSDLFDFSKKQSQAYGINSLVFLGNSLYGMYAGDGDSNGGISSTDRNNIWRLQNGKNGYLQGDFNLDGSVDNVDIDSYWSKSNGNLSQVPQ